jgi:hypothetical protein
MSWLLIAFCIGTDGCKRYLLIMELKEEANSSSKEVQGSRAFVSGETRMPDLQKRNCVQAA